MSFPTRSALTCFIVLAFANSSRAVISKTTRRLRRSAAGVFRRRTEAVANVKPGCYIVTMTPFVSEESNITTTTTTSDSPGHVTHARARAFLETLYFLSAGEDAASSSMNNTTTLVSLEPNRVFDTVFQGFSVCDLKPEDADTLAAFTEIESVDQNVDFVMLLDGSTVRVDTRVAVETNNETTMTSCPETPVIPPGVARVGGGTKYYNGTNVAWVVDSGVDATHPDLHVDLDLCYDATRLNGAAKDVDGECTAATDLFGHGTHVAGIIAGKCHQLGVAPGATIAPVRVVDRLGYGSLDTILAGLEYIAKNGQAGDVVVITGGGPGFFAPLNNAIQYLADKGLLLAIAAGNDHDDASFYAPGNTDYDNVYTVSAVDEQDHFQVDYSNYGESVSLAGPGHLVNSTFLNGEYFVATGTSMAAAHIAGVLLVAGGNVSTCGHATNDPDAFADPIGCIA